ncbi:type II toxin-antitoxin system VapC family toxin [Serpentinimonas maccroryi]|uniref:type II toxin-antitoxin system VapC family toxin n=1 Tax=Serpentinimonas maccroryi TaxID=1458426 RepID=UPI000BC94F56|nr:type II toxin-antitoxin system VapC family toxin [Serpentinimonas maccroryi]MBA4252720.1 VapC toxin family PIN domain ribonuclease [Comamonadaceae bacterium]MCM2479677.1 type II toxin-antitoxin system VapC family toxin [Serpentinimonas maccroryi]OYX58387.1 MAG: VapC toxin family PIN domain ribonuclease [Comamonadaceae bacterium 32-67-11]
MTARYLLDTNVLSELMRPQPDAAVLAWMERQTPAGLYTSAITMAEIEAGLALMPSGQRQRALQAAAATMFEQDFAGRLWAFDAAAAQGYAQVKAQRHRAGRPIGHADAQIAALALIHEATLVTRNLTDFAGIEGLGVLNPWASSCA